MGEDLAASIRRSPTCQVGNLDRLQNRLDRATAAQPFQDRQTPPIDLELGLRGAQEPGDGRGMQPGRQRLKPCSNPRICLSGLPVVRLHSNWIVGYDQAPSLSIAHSVRANGRWRTRDALMPSRAATSFGVIRVDQ